MYILTTTFFSLSALPSGPKSAAAPKPKKVFYKSGILLD